jgi:exodeoxyribonuclease VIII
VDWLTDDWILADWKTFDDLSEDGIERQMRRMKYQHQAGWYTEGASRVSNQDVKMFANVFIRVKDPIDCHVIILPDHNIEEARTRYRPLVHQYAECKRENKWPMRLTQGPTVLPLKPFFD